MICSKLDLEEALKIDNHLTIIKGSRFDQAGASEDIIFY